MNTEEKINTLRELLSSAIRVGHYETDDGVEKTIQLVGYAVFWGYNNRGKPIDDVIEDFEKRMNSL